MTSSNEKRRRPRTYNYKIRERIKYTGTPESTFDLNLVGFDNNVPVLTIIKDERIKVKSRQCTTHNNTNLDHSSSNTVDPSPNLCEKQTDTKPVWQINFFNDLKTCSQFNLNGNLPIHCAVLSNNLNLILRQCIALFVRYKSVDVHNFEALTPLQMAIIHDCCFEIIQTLLHYKADPFVIDSKGNTLIHLAVLHLNEGLLKRLLVLIEFDLNITNYNGETPLILCACNKKWGHAEVLLSAGADPNLGDKRSGRCPLFHAIEGNDMIMVKTLLEYGALTRVYNFVGLSPHEIVHELSTVSNGIVNLIAQNSQMQVGRKKKKSLLFN